MKHMPHYLSAGTKNREILCFLVQGWTVFSRASAIAVRIAMSVHHFGPDLNISTTTGWIDIKFYTGIHGPQR